MESKLRQQIKDVIETTLAVNTGSFEKRFGTSTRGVPSKRKKKKKKRKKVSNA